MGLIRRAAAIDVVEFLSDPEHKQTTGVLSRGLGPERAWCGVGAIAEVAARAGIIPPAVYWPQMNVWRYGEEQVVHVLPRKVCAAYSVAPVGPELVIPPFTVVPMPMLYLSDVGASFAMLADALTVTFLTSVPE